MDSKDMTDISSDIVATLLKHDLDDIEALCVLEIAKTLVQAWSNAKIDALKYNMDVHEYVKTLREKYHAGKER